MRKLKDAKGKYALNRSNGEKGVTPAEYLARERLAETKSEYYDGEIVMMAGGTGNHSIISGNVHTLLNNALETKPCVVFNSDMRLQLNRKEGYVYPDVMVVCGKIEYIEGHDDMIANPIVIVEVLSPSTYRRDHTEKFALYKQIPSLQAYIMVDSEQVHTWCIQRDADGKLWHLEIFNKLKESLRIESVDCGLPLRRIYHKVQFEESAK